MEKKYNLPKGWEGTKLEKVCLIILGQSPPSSTYNSTRKGLPFFQGKADFGKIYTKTRIWCSSPKKIARKNDLLLSVRAPVGSTNLSNEDCCIGRGLAAIRPILENIDIKFFFHFFRFIEKDLEGQGTGTTFKAISGKQIRELEVPIPPLEEQKRIVKKIEELFPKFDHAKIILENIQLQLNQYRQSLLKSAFEGKLTEKWREKNKSSLDILFKKIESNRKKQNTKLQKIKPFTDESPFTIPREWSWTRIGIISNEIQYGTSEKASTKVSKIPVLRMGNIQEGTLNFDKLKYYPNNWKSIDQFLLKDGDVLFNRTNSAELVGKTAIYRYFHPKAVFAGYLIRVKILGEIYAPYLLTWYINSIFGKLYVQSVVTQQVGQANVNGTKLALMPIPLMSNEEQEQIVSQIERAFSLLENTQNIVNSALQILETMKISILKQAFEGKLVPQDPNDEPASVLLERIKSKN